MTEQSAFTDPAADAAGALDLLLADAALGPWRRLLPGLAGPRFAAGLARRPRRLAVRGADLLREYVHIATGHSAVVPEKGWVRKSASPNWLRRIGSTLIDFPSSSILLPSSPITLPSA